MAESERDARTSRRSRLLSILLGVGLAALAAVALFDAAFSEDEPAATEANEAAPAEESEPVGEVHEGAQAAAGPPRSIAGRENLVVRLRASGVSGVLYFSDLADECRVHALALPDLRDAPPPELQACRFTLPPEGASESTYFGPDPVWQPQGGLAAIQRGGAIDVVEAGTGNRFFQTLGRSPAWRPNGTLSSISDGRVVQAPHPCAGRIEFCARTLLSREDLAQALALDRGASSSARAPDAVAAEEVAWLTNEVAAVIVAIQGQSGDRTAVVAVFEDGVLRGGTGLPQGKFSGLRTSPGGSYVAALATDSRGRRTAIVVDPGGGIRRLPDTISGVAAVAWSPDERWLAVATEGARPDDGRVYVLATASLGADPLELPLAAGGLVWRAS